MDHYSRNKKLFHKGHTTIVAVQLAETLDECARYATEQDYDAQREALNKLAINLALRFAHDSNNFDFVQFFRTAQMPNLVDKLYELMEAPK